MPSPAGAGVKPLSALLVPSLALPEVAASGAPIQLSFQPALTVVRGKLRSGDSRGRPVHAAAFLKERRLVLDVELQSGPAEELQRILLHELFHFVWWKLGRPRRLAYRELIEQENRRLARGEMGWSSERLRNNDAVLPAYLAESFCDTAAAYFFRSHSEITLAPTFRQRRYRWFAQHVLSRPLTL